MRAVKNGIEKEFGAQVAVTSESTPDTSGALEVQIVGGRMLHTKLGGQGYVDTPAKMRAILDGLHAHLVGGGTAV